MTVVKSGLSSAATSPRSHLQGGGRCLPQVGTSAGRARHEHPPCLTGTQAHGTKQSKKLPKAVKLTVRQSLIMNKHRTWEKGSGES